MDGTVFSVITFEEMKVGMQSSAPVLFYSDARDGLGPHVNVN